MHPLMRMSYEDWTYYRWKISVLDRLHLNSDKVQLSREKFVLRFMGMEKCLEIMDGQEKNKQG